MKYLTEIKRVLETALTDMQAQHQAGKLANTPITNTNFLSRWVSKQIKAQTFPVCVKDDLIRWQKMSRSQGSASHLPVLFNNILDTLHQIHPDLNHPQPILDKQIEDFMDHMESLGWEVVNEFEVTGKIQVYAEQANSFVLCAKQCEECFAASGDNVTTEAVGEVLVKPMSFYVRGNHKQFIEQALAHGFLLYKQTDYKSLVKYHGEYLIYPNNVGKQLPEIV